MRQATFSVDDENLAKFGFSAFQEAGIIDMEVLSCEGTRGVTRIRVEQKIDEERLNEVNSIHWWERVSDSEAEHVYIVESNAANTLDTMDINDIEFPRAEQISMYKRELILEVAGSQEQISNMATDLEAAGINASLQRLQNYRVQDSVLERLTARQREVLQMAYELGYYDVPRCATAAEVAAELGLDDSTVSEHLQRAEQNLISGILEE